MHLWISCPYATFALRVENGIVTESAPIASWAKGKPVAEVVAHWRRKGARVEELPPVE